MDKLRSGCVMLLLLVIAPGCVNGPVRYKTFGYRNYLTAEICSSGHFINPLLIPPAILADAVVVAEDTVAFPAYTVYTIWDYLMGEGGGFRAVDIPLYAISIPFWLIIGWVPVSYDTTFESEEKYQQWFGTPAPPLFAGNERDTSGDLY